MTTEKHTLLMAEDDPDDRLLIQEAARSSLAVDLRFVEDGQELLDYLRNEGKFKGEPRPLLILLDLNMPRKDGREALEEIKNDPKLRRIPVVVLTTSNAEEDIFQSYDLGACGFIVKPSSYDDLVNSLKTVERYWLKTVKLSQNGNGAE